MYRLPFQPLIRRRGYCSERRGPCCLYTTQQTRVRFWGGISARSVPLQLGTRGSNPALTPYQSVLRNQLSCTHRHHRRAQRYRTSRSFLLTGFQGRLTHLGLYARNEESGILEIHTREGAYGVRSRAGTPVRFTLQLQRNTYFFLFR